MSINQIKELNTNNLSLSQLANILENVSVDNIHTSFLGKRTILLFKGTHSISNPLPYVKTSFEALSKALVEKLNNYEVNIDKDYSNLTFFEKFDLTPKNHLEKYKNDIEQSNNILSKLSTLNDASKAEISKKYNFITRIFFFLRDLFNGVFFVNLSKAKYCLKQHELNIAFKEDLIKPLKKYHTANAHFSATTGIMTAVNIFLSLIGYTSIPYVSIPLNIATSITVGKMAYNHFTTAINQI